MTCTAFFQSTRRHATRALLLGTLALPAAAQSAALGNIAGDVRDASGAFVSGTTVVVTNTGTGASRTLTTDAQGHYAATFLQPGVYEVILGGGSYGKIDQKNVSVQVGQIVSVDATLPTASVSTDVVVSSTPPCSTPKR